MSSFPAWHGEIKISIPFDSSEDRHELEFFGKNRPDPSYRADGKTVNLQLTRQEGYVRVLRKRVGRVLQKENNHPASKQGCGGNINNTLHKICYNGCHSDVKDVFPSWHQPNSAMVSYWSSIFMRIEIAFHECFRGFLKRRVFGHVLSYEKASRIWEHSKLDTFFAYCTWSR